MIDTALFGALLKKRGFDFYSGVPCSFLKSLINYAVNECEFVMAANEGDAVAICAGAQTTGRKTVVLMQNSGLGNAVSPLTSLNAVFKIPVLGFVSLRGEPGLGDEPQHELMGVITEKMLETMQIDWEYLDSSSDAAEGSLSEALSRQLDHAETVLAAGKPFFFVVKKNSFSRLSLSEDKKMFYDTELPDRTSLLDAVCRAASPSSILAATTGFTGRELYTLGDSDRNFYMVGSLGCLSSFALGMNLAVKDHGVIVLDGDGSLLMRTGSLAVNAYYKPKKMLHILFDNGAHESTGGQYTVSSLVDWIQAAKAFGYPQQHSIRTAEELAALVRDWEKNGGLVFARVKIRQGAPEKLGRPKVKPREVAERLTRFIKGGK